MLPAQQRSFYYVSKQQRFGQQLNTVAFVTVYFLWTGHTLLCLVDCCKRMLRAALRLVHSCLLWWGKNLSVCSVFLLVLACLVFLCQVPSLSGEPYGPSGHLITLFARIEIEHERCEILKFLGELTANKCSAKPPSLNSTYKQTPLSVLLDFLAAPLEHSTIAAAIQLSCWSTFGPGWMQITLVLCGHLFGGKTLTKTGKNDVLLNCKAKVKCRKYSETWSQGLLAKGGSQLASALWSVQHCFMVARRVTRVHRSLVTVYSFHPGLCCDVGWYEVFIKSQ